MLYAIYAADVRLKLLLRDITNVLLYYAIYWEVVTMQRLKEH